MVDHHGRFAWYELITTDVAAAQAFYTKVVGWGAQDASTPGLPYTLFTAGTASVSGLMDLPDEARRKGRDAEVGGVCQRQGRGRNGRPAQGVLAEPCTSRRRTATSAALRSSLTRNTPTWPWFKG